MLTSSWTCLPNNVRVHFPHFRNFCLFCSSSQLYKCITKKFLPSRTQALELMFNFGSATQRYSLTWNPRSSLLSHWKDPSSEKSSIHAFVGSCRQMKRRHNFPNWLHVPLLCSQRFQTVANEILNYHAAQTWLKQYSTHANRNQFTFLFGWVSQLFM